MPDARVEEAARRAVHPGPPGPADEVDPLFGGRRRNLSTCSSRRFRALLGAKNVDIPDDLTKIRAELAEKVAEAKDKVPFAGRALLVQHATIVAAADGHVEQSELTELFSLAEGLGIDPVVIDHTLAGAAAPMD